MDLLFQILDKTDPCGGIEPIIRLIKFGVLPIIQIGIPIALILMGSIDLGKAVLASDDKEIKGAISKLVKRAIAAIAIFFIATLVTLIMGWIGESDSQKTGETIKNSSTGWADCWAITEK